MGRFLITAQQVLIGNDASPIHGGAVRVVDGRIAAVGTAAELERSDDETRLDLGTATILPGFIDCHEHLNGHDRFAIGDASVSEPDVMFAFVATFHGRRLLDEGITTARIVGCGPSHVDLQLRRAIAEGYVEGPRLVCAGQPIVMTGGHGHIHGYEVDGAAEATKAARRQLKAGVDLFKVMASGGVGITREGEEPSQPQLTVEEMSAVVAVAHAAGKRVTAHADGERGIGNALEAGVDCIEHGIFLTHAQAVWMAEHNVDLVPTLSTMVGIFERGIEWGMPSSWIPIAEGILGPHRASFQHALDAGVNFGTGTDGFGEVVAEIEQFVSFGMPRYRAIQAATRDAARVIGPLADSYGTLESGKSADLIAVGGDPLDGLDSLRDVRLVMLEGKIVRSRDSEPADPPR